jgi:hypothetical protein
MVGEACGGESGVGEAAESRGEWGRSGLARLGSMRVWFRAGRVVQASTRHQADERDPKESLRSSKGRLHLGDQPSWPALQGRPPRRCRTSRTPHAVRARRTQCSSAALRTGACGRRGRSACEQWKRARDTRARVSDPIAGRSARRPMRLTGRACCGYGGQCACAVARVTIVLWFTVHLHVEHHRHPHPHEHPRLRAVGIGLPHPGLQLLRPGLARLRTHAMCAS